MAVNWTFVIFDTFSGYFFLSGVPYNDIINNLQLSETWTPFCWAFPLFLAVNQSLDLEVEGGYQLTGNSVVLRLWAKSH